MREQQRRVDKQNNRSRTDPLRVMLLFFLTLTRLSRIFRGKHRQSLAHKPVLLSLVDMPAHWEGLVQKLECTAHSSHSRPIKNFHRLGQAAANQRQAFVVRLCYTSFMKSDVNVCKITFKTYSLNK